MSILGAQSLSEQKLPEIGSRLFSPFQTGGFLSDAGAQIVSGGVRLDIELSAFVEAKKRFEAAGAATKLQLLKQQYFTVDGRDRRIEKSLRALHGRQLFARPLQEWRWAVEDIEAEEQE